MADEHGSSEGQRSEEGPTEEERTAGRLGGLRGRLPFGHREPEGPPALEVTPDITDDTALLRPATARDPLERTADTTAASADPETLTPRPPETPALAESSAATPPAPALTNPALTPSASTGTDAPLLPPAVPEHASIATAAPEAVHPDPEPGYPHPGELEQILEIEPPSLHRPTPRMTSHLAVLTAIATLVMLAFLLIEPSPRWLLLLGAAAVIFGLDGTLRQTWRDPFASGAETAPYLFVPALYILAVPVLIEHNVRGELAVLVGLIAGGAFGALAWAETASVRPLSPEHPIGRLIATGGAYIAGFALFSLTYVFEVGLPSAVLAVALVSAMLAVELLREGEIDPLETLGFALVTGVVMAEARWLLYYMPLDTYLAGLTLLLAFYLLTGLLHSHITRALTLPLALEYSGIAAAGLALVVAARAVGLA